MEDLNVDEVLEIGGYDGTVINMVEELDSAVQEAFEFTPFIIHKSEVIDSK